MLLRLLPDAGLRFFLNDQYRTLFAARDPDNLDEERRHIALINIVLGSVTGMVTLGLTYPLDLARMRLAADQTRKYVRRQTLTTSYMT
jgi:hypothetical protein